MAPEKRKPHSSLKEHLFKDFFRFSFFRAVHLLEQLTPGTKPLGTATSPKEEAVRFSVKPGLVFPPSDMAGLSTGEEGGPSQMDIAFMGLVGPSGVLPHWYNELAIDRVREKDYALTSFFDIFHHRLLSLFYLGWKKYRLPENYLSGAKDTLSHHFLSLIGLGTPGLTHADGLSRESLIFCSGFLSGQVTSVAAIEATVEYFSGAPVRVEQFVERTIPLDPEDLTRIGTANSQLGVNAVCGSLIHENQTKFRVNLGPVGFSHFVRFLPGNDMLRPLFSLVRYMAGIEYEFDITVGLKREEVPPCTIGLTGAASPRLGWTTWLKKPGVSHSHDPYIVFRESDLPHRHKAAPAT